MSSWLKRLFGSDSPAREPATARHMVLAGASPRALESSDVSPAFLANLKQILSEDPNIITAWLLWVEWPDRPAELGISVQSYSADQRALSALCARVDALGGPPSFAALATVQPTNQPFYVRDGTA